MMLSLEEGKKLVELVRGVIESYFSGNRIDVKDYGKRRGVFVTLHTFPSKELRGCIGYIEPILDLNKALIEVANSAAFSDSRFMPLQKDEVEKIIVEVSVLTEPEIVKGVKDIKVGRDGLIIEYKGRKGLLLPIVAVEYKWDVKEFLENTCLKAGLGRDEWKGDDCRIYKFMTQVFSEKEPNGEIVEKKF